MASLLCREGGKASAERRDGTVGHEETHNGLNWSYWNQRKENVDLERGH